MDPQTSAPAVVAVVVTADPGPWLEESLAAFAALEYPNLSVLIIDDGSVDDPTARIAGVMPNAFVRRLPERVGFSQAANEVLAIVEGASHYLFCHDDVVPAPDTIAILIEEAFRSNAGIVSPKFIEWARPEHLLAVGQSADKTGVVSDLVQVGELDQEQHDSVRDVFCAPSGCMLVRADLFATLRGFDPEMDVAGEALNLSWRAQVVGARVVVAPAARVRHLEAIRTGERDGWDDPGATARLFAREEEHRVRTLFTCYGFFHLLRVAPQALLLSLAQGIIQLFSGRAAMAKATLLAWPRAFRKLGSMLSAHWALRGLRRVSDGQVRKLQTPGSANLRDFLRSAVSGETAFEGLASKQRISAALSSKSWRTVITAWVLVVLVVAFGSRNLLGHAIPGIGSLPVLGRGPGGWWSAWWSGWRPDGLGSAAPAPTGFALLAVGATVLLGGIGVLQKVLVLGPLLLGPLGAYRTSKPLVSPLARAAVMVTYAVVALPYNALASGRWPGLVAYAVAPWVLGWLCRLGGEAPFTARPRRPARVVALGLLLAIAAAFAPALLVAVPLTGVGLALGSLLAGRPVAGLKAMAASVGATVVAAVLLAPWSLGLARSRTAVLGVNLASSGAPRLVDLLQFRTGSAGGGVLGWGLLVAAALPLLMGRSWRLAWASRMWGVAIACWLVVWAGGRGFVPIPMAQPELFLAPAAAALALSVGLGAVAFKMDLPGYQLGWRQVASMTAAAGLAAASLTMLRASGGGRWNVAKQDFRTALSFSSTPNYRVLWVGDPRAIPAGSWQLSTGVGYTASTTSDPDATYGWPSSSAGSSPLLATDLRLAAGRLTTRLGHLLAPLAVQYIVIPNQTAAAGTGGSAVPVPADLVLALNQQTDLQRVSSDPALFVYRNAAWTPAQALLTPQQAAAGKAARDPEASQDVDLTGAVPVLSNGGPSAFSGTVPSSGEVFVSQTYQPAWHLRVGGSSTARHRSFGWAMSFTVTQGGKGSLAFATPITGRLLQLGELSLWVLAVVIVVSDRRRHGGWRSGDERGAADSGGGGSSEQPSADRDLSALLVDASARRPRWVTVPASAGDDEMWS